MSHQSVKESSKFFFLISKIITGIALWMHVKLCKFISSYIAFTYYLEAIINIK